MRRILPASLLFSFLAIALLVAQSTSGLVTRIVDGDTIVVSGIGTVRLIGVDTPETVHPRKPVEQFGAEASAFTRSIALNQSVRLELEGPSKDKYGRTLAYVYLADGRMLNAELIQQGFAHAYTVYPFSRMEAFRAHEREARDHARGLWRSEAQPTPASQRQVQPAQAADPAPKSVIVDTGPKATGLYHRDTCAWLNGANRRVFTLEEATKRYFQPHCLCLTGTDGPASSCTVAVEAMPETPAALPAPAPANVAKPASAAPRTTTPARTAGRCQAITKRGTQCSRSAQAGRSFCWQH
jgi:micrococcal nuclease